ncbi:MAG: secondary thiamine-phosphate synthase enzyme YjbQ [Candidatus Thermoplasmatota archaeon]|nr:secondary thiamine-phosphate synthase enzyme YjbQ [Candidatus Thermoplasmatota archaeon]
MIVSDEIVIKTKGELEIIDLTEKVSSVIEKAKLKKGILVLFVPGSTGALTTLEYEPGLLKDLPKALERLFPKDIEYKHHETWHDYNGHSHVRASFIGPSLTIPVKNGKLTLGTWQQIVFIELDVRARERRIEVQIIGE